MKLVKVEDLYPECKDKQFPWLSDYQPIINAFGIVLLQVDDDDYQGDTRVLYQDGRKIGYLQFGWGSCPGCDALQGCTTWADVQELIDSLQASIKWFPSKQDALKFFQEHDWAGDYSWRQPEQRRFVEEAIRILNEGRG